MKRITAAILGFAVAPLIPSLCGALGTPITRNFNLPIQLSLIPVFYGYALFFTIVFGVPSFLLIQHFRLVRWWTALVGGVVIGVIVLFVVHLPGWPAVNDFVAICPIGGASGLVFWLIWRQGQEAPKKSNDETR